MSSSLWKRLFLWGFDASWELDLFGKNQNSKQGALSLLLATRDQAKAIQIFVIGETAKLYTDIRGLQARLSLAKQRESTFNALLQHVQQLFTSGLANLQDVELSRSRLHACKSQTPLLEDALGQNVIQLSFLLGTTPQEILPQLRQEGRIHTGSCKIPVGLPSDLLKHRPDIQAAEHRLDAAGCFIGQAKTQLFPSFSLTGILGGASTLFPNLFTKSNRFWLAYPSGQFPIFQGGSLLANLHNANAEQQLYDRL